jgi:hypothetical protein
MSDEQTVRGLLARAAELPEAVDPPVQRLLHRARRARARRRAAYSVLSVIAVALVAALPPLVRSLGAAGPAVVPPSGLFPARLQPAPNGPATAQLARFRWSALPPSPLGRRAQPILTWTGNELIELAGPDGPVDAPGGWNDAAAAFSTETGSWHPIAPVPATMRLTGAFGVSTGRLMFVTNGSNPAGATAPVGTSAALYDPVTNRWTVTPLPQQLAGSTQLAATWTGQVIVVAGAQSGQISAAALNPATRQWTMLLSPVLPARHPAQFISIVASPDRVIVWSLWYRTTPGPGYGVDVLALGRDGAWSNVTHGWPQEQVVESPVYAGSAILVSPGQIWCGACSHPLFFYPGLIADPATLKRTVIAPGPLGEAGPAFIWTGRGIIAVNLDSDISGPGTSRVRPGDMASYDPASGRWHVLPAPPGYPALPAAPVWAGAQLLELTNAGQLLAFHR